MCVAYLVTTRQSDQNMEPMSDSVPRSAIRIFLIAENRLLREALARLFRKRSDLLVVGESGSQKISTSEVRASNCDILVISFDDNRLMPTLEDGTLTHPGYKTLLVGMDADEDQFLAAVRAGARGYLLKEASASDVVGGVRAVHRGEAVCPRQFCLRLFRIVAELPRDTFGANAGPRPELTIRQQQLVALVAKGLTNKEIASHLNLSEFTVRNHIHRILKQVDAESRSEAVETIRSHGYSIIS